MTTVTGHMPVKHEKHHKWTPGRLMNWAKDIGDETRSGLRRYSNKDNMRNRHTESVWGYSTFLEATPQNDSIKPARLPIKTACTGLNTSKTFCSATRINYPLKAKNLCQPCLSPMKIFGVLKAFINQLDDNETINKHE
jgi:hypothetical protein